MTFNNEQRSLLKSLLKQILDRYNKQQISYNPQNHSLTIDQSTITLQTSNPRSTISTRTTHIR